MIQAKNLCKSFDGNEVLKNVSLHLEQGGFMAVMGQSGGGKSTLLYCVSGMDKPTSGTVSFQGRSLADLSEKEMDDLRLKHMGFIFQRANFLKNLSIEDNIIFPAFQAGVCPRSEIVKEAEAMMKRMGIAEVASQDIRTVSGGQLQRAAICRAMINHPEILFGDEPTGALNSSATGEVLDILGQINREGTAVLLVTHDAKVAARADRVVYLEDGAVKEELALGRFVPGQEAARERRMSDWLSRLGF